ncbi:proline-rich protein 1-like [Abrus precatorius]|uniref:Proline-rich protein 1-like n=1 Tax=Abrus precatorius TaxID=3816 RepID=A0A8B8MGU4_ABRPR|nr:proline-rich protein 1-like [Abrus precatorius]
MAFLQSLVATSMLLSALLVFASATDYGYGPATLQNPKPETDYKPQPTKPDYEVPKPEKDYYKPQPTKPDYEVPKPIGEDEVPLLPTIISVQGVVLCKSGSNYFPIQGAVARVTCGCVDENGYETGPISVLSDATDGKGYFLATVTLAEFGHKLKFGECKAYLDSSPLETCKVPSDVNYGISGATLSSYRTLDNKKKLYSVGPFFCTSQSPPYSSP